MAELCHLVLMHCNVTLNLLSSVTETFHNCPAEVVSKLIDFTYDSVTEHGEFFRTHCDHLIPLQTRGPLLFPSILFSIAS